MPGDAAAACKGYATYNLTFIGLWNIVDHPTNFPNGSAVFSPIIGASHNDSYNMWGPNLKATPGIKDVAEMGELKLNLLLLLCFSLLTHFLPLPKSKE